MTKLRRQTGVRDLRSIMTSALMSSLRLRLALSKHPMSGSFMYQSVRGAVGGKKASKGAVKKKEFDVEKDPKKLVTHCCGLNYQLEGEEVPLKPDSEYPDWLWKMDIKRPLPPSHEMEPGTMEYFLKLREEYIQRQKTVNKMKRKIHKY